MKVKIKQLKINDRMIEMRPVDAFTVSRYRIAMRAGADFPMIKVKSGSLEIVSGYHRRAAYLEEYGEDHLIEVDARKYKTEADALREAVRDNITHGRPMDGITKRRFALALINAGDDVQAVADLLNVPVGNLERWGDLTVCVVGKDKTTRTMPMKHGATVPSGRVTEKEYADHMRRDVGMTIVALADQLADHLERGWFDKTDEVEAALERLKKALENI